MEENRENQQNAPKRELRGLYKHVKIPVKALDAIIIACILVIVAVLCIEMQDPGFTVTFDSKGGSDVPALHQVMFGDLITFPEPPTREGYTFTGWYKDYACCSLWDEASDIIETDLTLYAGWEKKP